MIVWIEFLLFHQVEESQIIEDLSVPDVPNLTNRISIYKDAYAATKDTHAIVLCTEWDEFMVTSRKLPNEFNKIESHKLTRV